MCQIVHGEFRRPGGLIGVGQGVSPGQGEALGGIGSASGTRRAGPDRRATLSYTLSCQTARGSEAAPGIRHIPEDSARLRLHQDIRVGLAHQGHGWTGQGSGSWRPALLQHHWERGWWHWGCHGVLGSGQGVALKGPDRDSQPSPPCHISVTSTQLLIFIICCSWFSSRLLKNFSLLSIWIRETRFQSNTWISKFCICGGDTRFIFYG